MDENQKLEQSVKETLLREYNKGILVGAQVVSKVILDKIDVCLSKPEKLTFNESKRLIKDISNFCQTGLSRKINPDGTTSEVDESTVQN